MNGRKNSSKKNIKRKKKTNSKSNRKGNRSKKKKKGEIKVNKNIKTKMKNKKNKKSRTKTKSRETKRLINSDKIKNKKRREAKKKKVNIKRILATNPLLRKYIIDVGGEQALAIVQALKNDKCTEEVILKRSKAGKSDARATLNKLHGKRLVKYSREKDANIGLYTYTWSLRVDKLKEIGEKLLLQNKDTNERTKIEKYKCKACGAENEYSFEEAMDLRFKCPFCNSLLDLSEDEEES
ncbi:hypothetical protein J7J26_00130 [Candidatus Micrarchaeota archaeon]|nr:hypothetical protein [Candidatus Micrarchaeota archaeon]